jgi:hypothetical protein
VKTPGGDARLSILLVAGGTPALPCDHAAGDSVACVAGGISLLIVRFGVNHKGRATAAEQRVTVVAEGDVVIHD